AHASTYELLPALIGRLSRTYNFDEKIGWRLFEWTAGGLAFMTEMTYSHEQGGHGGAARRFGYDPNVTLKAPWSGETDPGVPTLPPDQSLIFSAAGVNQQTINASRMVSRWALRKSISYQEAMAYLQVLLSRRGPLLGGRSTINVNGRFPVEVSIDASLDEPGLAVGAQLHAPITPALTLSPFGRFSYSQSEGAGGLLGIEARYK